MTNETASPTGIGGAQTVPQQETVPGRKLGKLPAKVTPKTLHLARFATPPKVVPTATKFWPKRRSFPLRMYGNNAYGDCTRAKQAIASMRMERLEIHRTPMITDDEVIRVYKEMTTRRYGADWVGDPNNADTGAYEEDALSDWRRPELTFKDTKGRALTIDAYLRVDHTDPQAIKEAIFAAGAHGIALCFNLPDAWKGPTPPAKWDLPEGQAMIGAYMPGSWGGHSMWARDYDEDGVWICHTWGLVDQLVSWRGIAGFCDEVHVVIDSMDVWRKKPGIKKVLDLEGIRKEVNRVSSQQIA